MRGEGAGRGLRRAGLGGPGGPRPRDAGVRPLGAAGGGLRAPSRRGARAARPGAGAGGWGALPAAGAGAGRGIVSLARRSKVPRRSWSGRPGPEAPGPRPRLGLGAATQAPGHLLQANENIPTRDLGVVDGKTGKWLVFVLVPFWDLLHFRRAT